MNWTWSDILAQPREGDCATIKLSKGDTAYLPGTSKWVAQCTSSTAQLKYYISPMTSQLVEVIGDITQVRPS